MSKQFWDDSFSGTEFAYGHMENEFINEKSDLISARSKVACFAEGEGRNAVYLAKEGHDVSVYDQSAVGLEKAKKLAEQNNVFVNTFEIDLTKEKIAEEDYDAAIMVYGHVPRKDQLFLLNNIIDSVKEDGIILIEGYSTEQLKYKTGGPGSVDMLYDPNDILNWIKDYKCLHFYYGEAVRHEGKRHHGLGHIVQIVIQKSSI